MKSIYLVALVVTTTVANVLYDQVPSCSIWHAMGRIPHESDCTKYYQCFFGIPRLLSCPIVAGKQTYFFPTFEVCIWSSNPPCNNPPPPVTNPPPPVTNPPPPVTNPPPPVTNPPPPVTNPPPPVTNPPPPVTNPPPPVTNPPPPVTNPPPPVTNPPPPVTNPPPPVTNPPPPVTNPPPPVTNPPPPVTNPPPPVTNPPPPGPSVCKDRNVEYPTHRPDDCMPDQMCNSPIKDDCKHYIYWSGNEKTTRQCGNGLYYDVRVQACTQNACPPCLTPTPS